MMEGEGVEFSDDAGYVSGADSRKMIGEGEGRSAGRCKLSYFLISAADAVTGTSSISYNVGSRLAAYRADVVVENEAVHARVRWIDGCQEALRMNGVKVLTRGDGITSHPLSSHLVL